MRKLFRHKWIVGVSALVLTLAIGAGAWAVTGTPSTHAFVGDSLAGAVDGSTARPVAWQATTTGQSQAGDGLFGRMREWGQQSMQDCPALGDLRQSLEQRRQEMQERRNAILDLVRGKMPVEDQAKLDQLLQTAEQQKETLKKAAEDLRATMQQIRDLVDKYLPAGTLPNQQVPTDQSTGETMSWDTSPSGGTSPVF